MAALTLRSLGKAFGSTTAVEAVSLEIAQGELLCLLGPSGSGKSTVLRMIGGFERPTDGAVLIDGRDVTGVPPERRPTSMMFQSHALWSHMSVAQNIAFGLRLRGMGRAAVRAKVEEALDLVGLPGLGARGIDQLSGGQQSRVALARSLVLEPRILLLDEPFAALDQHLRERLREEVRDLQRRLGITMVFVTHGQDEALAIADRIAVMRAGRVEQVDAPSRLYREPATPFVAGFIGHMNLLGGEVRGGRFLHAALACRAPIPDGPALLAVRPEALAPERRPDGAARVRRVTDHGSHAVIDVGLPDGTRLRVLLPDAGGLAEGAAVALAPRRYILFRDDRPAWRSPEAAALEAAHA